ncbi:uncharacterized protein LOC107479942 isoform X1 [Arachis duranensis]|uniref:Uncharacterized protein LOC107479942 isoform X1 n=1 Tax=Arachis duranensis TaxID=130453 RepID=A0A6P4CQT9_ARADU|nr:uncharacterized protein LOC107479942 isoform X1 [Arachis duranensis]XP_052114647.1 uncharacterized protein LOC107479942 isoform X1 [Arachis duranensis]
MSGCNKSPKSDQHSIKYKRNQHGGSLSRVNHKPSVSNSENKQCYTSSEPKPKHPQILSTAQLISAVGQIWDSASCPLSVLLREENGSRDDKGFPIKNIPDGIHVERNGGVCSSTNTNYFQVNVGATAYGSQILQEKIDFPTVTQKALVLQSRNGRQEHIGSLFQRFMQATDNSLNEYRKETELGTEKISFQSRNVYWWMSRDAPKRLKYHVKATDLGNKKVNSPVGGDCISTGTSTLTVVNESDVCNPDLVLDEDLPLSSDTAMDRENVSTLCSDYFLPVLPDTNSDVGAWQISSSNIYADYHIKSLHTRDSASIQCQHKLDNNEMLEIQRRHFADITDDEAKVQSFAATPQKPCYSVAKQEHAFSGALAGVCVSLCLHPVDTIKTVIQSCRAEQRSIVNIGKSVVSDRGLLGLYRGITTNIACSAPISAVYTFTYESIKAALVPYLPKEYYSFAHCVGGGAASIATSFIFTPSERIKQQMQVGSHYRSCWDALVGIIRNGGFTSLYAGWGAVLCRNVPHSIIKFYTYESLKKVMPSLSSTIQPNAFQTLLCGGLAGSTAALFTTPFDVIKTRLQTQLPGSINQYDNVFQGLYKISKSEGLKGLYRGLTPRLIMYMSQGSLFFASYEFFKKVFSLEACNPTGSHVHKC